MSRRREDTRARPARADSPASRACRCASLRTPSRDGRRSNSSPDRPAVSDLSRDLGGAKDGGLRRGVDEVVADARRPLRRAADPARIEDSRRIEVEAGPEIRWTRSVGIENRCAFREERTLLGKESLELRKIEHRRIDLDLP